MRHPPVRRPRLRARRVAGERARTAEHEDAVVQLDRPEVEERREETIEAQEEEEEEEKEEKEKKIKRKRKRKCKK